MSRVVGVRGGRARLRVRGGAGDRGATLVEFALVAPLLVLLLLGVFEFGLAWRARVNLETSISLAARQNSNLADVRQADYESLQSLQGSIASAGNLDVTKVVVYKATGVAGQPSNPACLTTAPQPNGVGISGACNIYHPTQLAGLGTGYLTHFGTGTACASTAWDRWWCPLTRNADQGDPPDWVGVRVEADLPAFTGLFGDGFEMVDTAVFRLEPDPQ